MHKILLFIMALGLLSCTKKTEVTGTWRGIIAMQEHELAFTFDLKQTDDGKYTAVLHNAEEEILLDEVSVVDDTITMVLHIFDAKLKAKIQENKLSGYFIKNYDLTGTLPFSATKGDAYRYAPAGTASVDFTGKYAVTFTSETDTTQSVGIFNQQGNIVTGTFLTPTGDYRYLQGNVVNNQLIVSTFDGNHAYVFTAQVKGDSISGDFYAGKLTHERWKGVKNENATLPDAESLTYLKEGYDQIEFSFPDVDGKKVSPQDEKYKGKVLVLQIFGTWCPNCMDETKFLTSWYNQNKDRGVEILGLAYERKDDFAYASERVKKMKAKLNVPYDFVIAGTNDKEKASQTLPMLNKIISFPTTIIIGKDGKVKRIHTGFSGPGTGIYYEQFKEHFNEIINASLAESL